MCGAGESVCALQASVPPRGQHWVQKNVFLSQWFHPHRLVFMSSLKKMSANSSPFVSSQCNNSSNENGTSNEKIEREVAPTAEFVRTLFWTSGRITTGSSAWRREIKTTHYYHKFAPWCNPDYTWIVLRSGIIRKDTGLVNIPAGSLLDGLWTPPPAPTPAPPVPPLATLASWEPERR